MSVLIDTTRKSVMEPIEVRRRPIRILEFRCASGVGGGPDKTILLGAARTNPERFAVTVCYIRDRHDRDFEIDARAARLGVDFVEIHQKSLFDPAVWHATRSLIRRRRIDIVHAHDYKTNLLALLLARVENVIPLSTAHGWTGHSWKEKLLYYPADKRLLPMFPQLIAVSSQIRTQLLQFGTSPSRICTVLNGIDHRVYRRDREREASARAKLGFAGDDLVIGSMGRLEPQKRFDILLEAFASLLSRRPNLRLLIAGSGSLRGTLEAKANQLGLGTACRFLGHWSDVAGLHHALNVFVQSSDYEGTPNVLLEAMALETPVVATAVGGTAEIIDDGVHGLLVPPRNSELLVQAVDRTLTRWGETARRTAAARTRVERELSFDVRMQAVEEIYEKLARRRESR